MRIGCAASHGCSGHGLPTTRDPYSRFNCRTFWALFWQRASVRRLSGDTSLHSQVLAIRLLLISDKAHPYPIVQICRSKQRRDRFQLLWQEQSGLR